MVSSSANCMFVLWDYLSISLVEHITLHNWARFRMMLSPLAHIVQNLIFNSLRPTRNRRHLSDDSSRCIFLKENVLISINISLKFISNGPITYIQALVQIRAWCRPGDKPLSEPMMIISLTHICVTRPLWVKSISSDFWKHFNLSLHTQCAYAAKYTDIIVYPFIYLCVCLCVGMNIHMHMYFYDIHYRQHFSGMPLSQIAPSLCVSGCDIFKDMNRFTGLVLLMIHRFFIKTVLLWSIVISVHRMRTTAHSVQFFCQTIWFKRKQFGLLPSV